MLAALVQFSSQLGSKLIVTVGFVQAANNLFPIVQHVVANLVI